MKHRQLINVATQSNAFYNSARYTVHIYLNLRE